MHFDDATDVITIDGIRVEWEDGFALARSSNTTPVVVLRLEGDTPEALERIKTRFGNAIKEIYTKDGYQLYQRNIDDENQILDEHDVEQLTSMLQEVISTGTGKRARISDFAAGKTGTSQDNRDAWFVGFTNDLVAAVWLGNDDNSPMKNVSGSNLPAEIWQKIMTAAQKFN